MPLETATYISDLVASNPAHSDGLNQADAHARLIKGAVKTTFPNITGALSATQSQLDAAVAAVVLGTGAGVFKPGTVTAPGLAPLSNPNTGIYSPATNKISITCNGASVLDLTTTSVAANQPFFGATVTSTGAFGGGTGQLVPIGGTIIWHEDTLPAEGGYCWANGQAISRAANPILWARWGTKYGAGDGSTTFNVPNLCEVVPVGQRAMGGASSRALLATGALGGAVLGEATHVLTTPELPAHTHANTLTDPTHNHAFVGSSGTGGSIAAVNGAGGGFGQDNHTASTATGITINNVAAGGGGAHNNVQPSYAVNFIIRIG